MAKYQRKAVKVDEAFQWFKHGDHPDVEPLNVKARGYGTREVCFNCGKKLVEHGSMEQTICPGNWVVVFPGYYVKVYSDKEFHEKFEEI